MSTDDHRSDTRSRLTRKIRLADVARGAGVSPATASLALRGTGTIGAATAERVRKVAAELGYRPNHVAASLRRQWTALLGVLIPTLTNPYYSELLEAFEAAAGRKGYGVISGSANHDPAQESRYVDLFLRRSCDGIVVVTATGDIGAAVHAGVPTVLVNAHGSAARVPRVEIDDFRGVHAAVTHLLSLGHRRIGLVTHPYDQPRHEGYRRALSDAGIGYDPHLVATVTRMNSLIPDGRDRARELLQAHPDLTAVIGTADVIAIGVLRAAHEAGRKVPDDLAVVGFDDISLSSTLVPALTTVAQPIEAIAATALDLVRDQIEVGNVTLDDRRVILETCLVVRESCGAKR
jgi:DNA-binding LacI/PurR family transcriptional regulator